MDILNWLYLVKNKFVRTTLGSEKDLMIFGSKVGFNKRGDLYQNYAMSVEDFAASLPAPEPAYKIYTALLTQTGTNNPVITVLENTLGTTVSIIRNGLGSYAVVNNLGPWDLAKTTFLMTGTSGFVKFSGSLIPDYIPVVGGGTLLNTYANTGSNPPNILPSSDGLLLNTPIEIRVYN